MLNLDDITTKNDNKDWPYRKLIIGPSGSGKIYLYTKDLEGPKYQLLIKKTEQAGVKKLKDATAFIFIYYLYLYL